MKISDVLSREKNRERIEDYIGDSIDQQALSSQSISSIHDQSSYPRPPPPPPPSSTSSTTKILSQINDEQNERRNSLTKQILHQFKEIKKLDKNFEIEEKFELGNMTEMFLNRYLSRFFFISIIAYLFGDLLIYNSMMSKSLRELIWYLRIEIILNPWY